MELLLRVNEVQGAVAIDYTQTHIHSEGLFL